MLLTKDEHLRVVVKLTSYMEKLIPQEIPSFVYQLLTLCRHQNGRVIFAKLQHYFGLRIYNCKNFWKDSSSESSPDLDLIGKLFHFPYLILIYLFFFYYVILALFLFYIFLHPMIFL